METWRKTTFLSQQGKIESRGWTLDVIKCIEQLKSSELSLNQLYKFEFELARKHPQNKFVKDKIRQQLQLLRDKGFLDLLRPGHYKLRD